MIIIIRGLLFLYCITASFAATQSPTCIPSGDPTSLPSQLPSATPTSSYPTGMPSALPSTYSPTSIPSALPSSQPTEMPTILPTSIPSGRPTGQPSAQPTSLPSSVPTQQPTAIPSAIPTSPTSLPSSLPTRAPSGNPTGVPSTAPSAVPSHMPTSSAPTCIPVSVPSSLPSAMPSAEPSGLPTSIPSGEPTAAPSAVPTSIPTSSPTLPPGPYNGTECVGVVDYLLFSTTPFDELEYNVSRLMSYQAPVWIDISCKERMRQYSCALVYQPYGVWFNHSTGERVELKYCTSFCDFVMDQCADYFDLAKTIDLKYKDRHYAEQYSTDPQTFVQDQCMSGTYNASAVSVCYIPSASDVVEASAECPDPAVVPDRKTLQSDEPLYIPRFRGSECAIACPNLWYRKGTFYLNSFILYIVSGLSCVLGIVTLFQHLYVIYQARVVAQRDVTVSVMAARKKTALSEQVVMLCFGVSISNTASVLFMMVNNLSEGSQRHPLQCEGNSGFLLHNSLCMIQGSLIIFSICWQQAWTGKICSHIFGIIRPYDKLAIFFQTMLFKSIQGYFCYLHPIVCVIIFLALKCVGNFWKSEYNFCGPSFGKSYYGDLSFLLLIWLPVMVLGPLFVLFCTSLVIKSVQRDIRPTTAFSTERFETRSSVEDCGSNRESDLSLVSVDFASESGMGGVRLSEFGCRESNLPPSEISQPPLPLRAPRLTEQSNPPRRPKFVQYFLSGIRSFYVYRRIVFLILSSVIAVCAAVIFVGIALRINRFSQEAFYDCMLKESAFDIQAASRDNCGGQARRIEVSWRIFVVQIFMISFGIGPFFAFGTESVRGAVKRVSKVTAVCVGKYFVATVAYLRANIRLLLNRPVNSGPVKGDPEFGTTRIMSGDAATVAQSTVIEDKEEVKSPMSDRSSGLPATRTRADTDVFSDVLSGDIRLSDFMQGAMSYEEEGEFQ